MSQQIICDRCSDILRGKELFARLSITALSTVESVTIDLCETCTEIVIRATKEKTWEESKFFPDSFGKQVEPSTSPEPVPEPADGVALSTTEPTCSVPPSAPQPSVDPTPTTSPSDSVVSIKPEHSDVF